MISPYDAAALVSRSAEYEAWEQARQAATLHAQQQKASSVGHVEETPAEGPATEAHDRFGHLEL